MPDLKVYSAFTREVSDVAQMSAEELRCTGFLPDKQLMPLDQWINQWSPECIDVFSRSVNGVKDPGVSIDSVYRFSLTDFQRVQRDFELMFSRLYNAETTSRITNPGKTGYHPFQPVLLDTCRQIPGACQRVQSVMCEGLSRGDIASESHLVSLCGCVAPSLSSFYGEQYVPPSPECDPLCSQQLSIRLRDTVSESSTYGESKVCNATICVIDDVTIRASKSSTGGVDFTQVCPSCVDPADGNQCKCIVNFSESTAQNVIGSGLTEEITFRQYCPNAVCLTIDSVTGVITEKLCDTLLSSRDPRINTEVGVSVPSKPIPSSIGLLGLIVLGIVVLIIMALLIESSLTKKLLQPWRAGGRKAFASNGRMLTSFDFTSKSGSR